MNTFDQRQLLVNILTWAEICCLGEQEHVGFI